MVLNHLNKAIFVLFLLTSISANASILAGRDYRIAPGIPPAAKNQPIPVTEFFWYDCPHCYAIENQLVHWSKQLPKDVMFRHVPDPLGNWKPMAILYYTLQDMGYGQRYHEAIFHATQVQKLTLENPSILSKWLTSKGINPTRFNFVSQSFGVHTQVNEATQLALQYQAFEVPTFIVDNQYVTNMAMAKSKTRLFKILDALIVKARTEK
ncbi:MAG: thiol:disulfide interchange protein DsbA/DsbL [Proteobacteria bacterium]|nr:thiol:disulfide interchange protein DsbA/DsbL [Pseudomonadota bacterium]